MLLFNFTKTNFKVDIFSPSVTLKINVKFIFGIGIKNNIAYILLLALCFWLLAFFTKFYQRITSFFKFMLKFSKKGLAWV